MTTTAKQLAAINPPKRCSSILLRHDMANGNQLEATFDVTYVRCREHGDEIFDLEVSEVHSVTCGPIDFDVTDPVMEFGLKDMCRTMMRLYDNKVNDQITSDLAKGR